MHFEELLQILYGAWAKKIGHQARQRRVHDQEILLELLVS